MPSFFFPYLFWCDISTIVMAACAVRGTFNLCAQEYITQVIGSRIDLFDINV
uniref:Uncharacterized protein n=1 Tax=Rhizophora mucronata TaxID=61149 RepID=A0A2P2J5A9_RHIMU